MSVLTVDHAELLKIWSCADHKIRAPGQTLKQSTKIISSAIFSQQISGKKNLRVKKLLGKVSQKVCRSELTLNCRSLIYV